MRYRHLIPALALVAAVVVAAQQAQQSPPKAPGFTDTPMLPGLPWHVHDSGRPHPAIVTPAAQPGDAPSDADVLFNGKDLSKWVSAELDTADYTVTTDPAPWKVQNGYFEVVPDKGDIATKEKFGDVQLHVEWMEPPDVKGASQNRGNSGIFLAGLFEVQVLDSYQNLTYADGQAGAIYGQWPPLVNAAKKPGEWQSYDIVFEGPRFTGNKLARPAAMTVFWNGVLLHNHKEMMGPTVYKEVAKYTKIPAEGPLILQEHGNVVRYRNIWVRRLAGYDQPGK